MKLTIIAFLALFAFVAAQDLPKELEKKIEEEVVKEILLNNVDDINDEDFDDFMSDPRARPAWWGRTVRRVTRFVRRNICLCTRVCTFSGSTACRLCRASCAGKKK